MSANAFSLLWGKILDSSIWMEPLATRVVWIAMLAMKDSEGIVRSSVPGLAHRARVDIEDCVAALEKFRQPDKYSQSQEEDGRRIRDLPGGGGWQLINHEKYRFSSEAKREFWREMKAKQREAMKGKVEPVARGVTAAERHADKCEKNGRHEEAERTLELSEKLQEAPFDPDAPAPVVRRKPRAKPVPKVEDSPPVEEEFPPFEP